MTYVSEEKKLRRGKRPRRRRFMPGRRWQRMLIWLVIVLGYIALMWFVVFPWADRIVNRPAV
jgi:hypothetical protein